MFLNFSKNSSRRFQGSVAALVAFPLIGTAADRPHSLTQAITAAASQGQPSISVLTTASGAPLQSIGAGSASLALGRTAYYSGQAAAGVTQQKTSGSMILVTRFALKVDCGAQSSLAEVSMSLLSPDPFYTVSVDGIKLSAADSLTVLRCGSMSEHRLEIEIPKTRPAGPIGSTVWFSATAK